MFSAFFLIFFIYYVYYNPPSARAARILPQRHLATALHLIVFGVKRTTITGLTRRAFLAYWDMRAQHPAWQAQPVFISAQSVYVYMHTVICLYIYIYIYIHTHIYIYI